MIDVKADASPVTAADKTAREISSGYLGRNADVYPRLGYNKPDLRNPFFIAF